MLQHLLGSLRGSGSAGAAPAFDNAASQLQLLLGGPAWRSGQAGELAEELLDKAEQLVGSKQVREGGSRADGRANWLPSLAASGGRLALPWCLHRAIAWFLSSIC